MSELILVTEVFCTCTKKLQEMSHVEGTSEYYCPLCNSRVVSRIHINPLDKKIVKA